MLKKKKKEAKKTREKSKKRLKIIISIFVRYIILILLSFKNLYLFYTVFFFLTVYPLLFLFNLFYSVSLSENILILENVGIELVNACIAGSAYYFLLILNLTTPMKIKKRVYSILFSFMCLLILNILRIFFFGIFFMRNFSFFDIAHKAFWYVLSTIFVVAIWFLTVKLFRIKDVPVYSDFKKLLELKK